MLLMLLLLVVKIDATSRGEFEVGHGGRGGLVRLPEGSGNPRIWVRVAIRSNGKDLAVWGRVVLDVEELVLLVWGAEAGLSAGLGVNMTLVLDVFGLEHEFREL